MNRRRFLQAVAATSTTPMWLHFADQAVAAPAGEGRVRTRGGGHLLVVFLRGGNDPLNTVVPYLDPTYRRLRPHVALRETEVLPMGNGFGLHSALGTLHERWKAGQLAVVQQVGTAKNDFSHFASTAIWETASPDRRWAEGWLGRYLDATTPNAKGPVRAVALGEIMPTMLTGRGAGGVALESIVDYAFADTEAPDAQLRHGTFGSYSQSPAEAGSSRAAVLKSQREVLSSLDPVTQTSARNNPRGIVPSMGETVAQMFSAGVGTEVGFVALDGFDTHNRLVERHAYVLKELNFVVSSFFSSAAQLGVADRSTVMVVSEFGRRVPQNNSYGTDHGDAGTVLLIGPRVRGGMYGPKLDLSQLKDGNLPVKIDLRRVYASVLEQWMGVNHSPILGGRFSTFPLFT
ncbi:MAG TPA: DUF1501 domain-containing protein [Acidimicrobiales bacterium]|nr:DUF1501 domain-containing protein [Acidimicrobiales bacterium]